MQGAVGQRQNDDDSSASARALPAPASPAWPNYLPAVIVAGALSFVMAFVTILIVRAG